MRETMLVHFLDEVAQHLLGDVEVRDHAVLQRPDRADRSGRAPEHALRLEPDCVHIAGRLVDRDDRRLAQHDPAPAHVHERVGRAEVDGHVASAEPGQIIEDAHRQDQPTVPALALALALGSAVLHAAWNLLLARARDVQAAAAATFLISIVVVVPFAAVWWHADASVWPYALASTVFESVYIVALAYAYRTGEVSFVYPLTRGLAPVLTLGVAVAFLGHGATAAEAAGVLLVAVGIVLVRGPGGPGDARGLLLVATIGATIAAYTLLDRVGIHRAGAMTYFVLVLVGPSLVYPALVGWQPIRRELGVGVAAAAVANLGSFALGLLALRRGAAAPVLAVRSSSIVFATLLAGRVLAEHVPPVRLAGSVLVFGGVALLAL